MKKLLILLTLVCSLSAKAGQHVLWYAQPARHWLEALPIGNSQMGVMVFGNPDVETLALNEETFWSGQPTTKNNGVLEAIRPLTYQQLLQPNTIKPVPRVYEYDVQTEPGKTYTFTY